MPDRKILTGTEAACAEAIEKLLLPDRKTLTGTEAACAEAIEKLFTA